MAAVGRLSASDDCSAVAELSVLLLLVFILLSILVQTHLGLWGNMDPACFAITVEAHKLETQ